jgi:hypothetical protein
MDAPASRESLAPRYLGVGCLMLVAGFFSGSMIGVLAGKVVGMARRCVPPEGLPACSWWWFALGGGVLGAISLPTLTLRRLRRSAAAENDPDRG